MKQNLKFGLVLGLWALLKISKVLVKYPNKHEQKKYKIRVSVH